MKQAVKNITYSAMLSIQKYCEDNYTIYDNTRIEVDTDIIHNGKEIGTVRAIVNANIKCHGIMSRDYEERPEYDFELESAFVTISDNISKRVNNEIEKYVWKSMNF